MKLRDGKSKVANIMKNDEQSKKEILRELKEAIKELQLIEQGKLKARPATDLLNEL